MQFNFNARDTSDPLVILDITQSTDVARKLLDENASLLDLFQIRSQFCAPVVKLYLDKGYIPSFEYIDRVTYLEELEVVELLCEYGLITKVIRELDIPKYFEGSWEETEDDVLSLLAEKQAVAKILLKHKVISQKLYDRYVPSWNQDRSCFN